MNTKIQQFENVNGSERTRLIAFESLEARQLMTASVGWDGPGLGGEDLQYYVGTAPASLSQAAFESSIQTALDAWSQVVDVQFVRTSQPGQDNSLDFGVGSIDGAGGTLAEAYFPDDVNSSRVAGDVQFDATENWEVGNARGSRAYDIVLIAVHEIGHALGLNHLEDAGSILLPSISPSQQFCGLDQSDIAAIRQLYSATSVPNQEPTVPNTEPPVANVPKTPPTVNTPKTAPQWNPWISYRPQNNLWNFENRSYNLGRFEIHIGSFFRNPWQFQFHRHSLPKELIMTKSPTVLNHSGSSTTWHSPAAIDRALTLLFS